MAATLTIAATAVQTAVTPFQPESMMPACHDVVGAANELEIAAQRRTMLTIAAAIPGKARFQGNESGGGVAFSRRTATMTEVTKPAEGAILCSLDKMRSKSSSLIGPPDAAVLASSYSKAFS